MRLEHAIRQVMPSEVLTETVNTSTVEARKKIKTVLHNSVTIALGDATEEQILDSISYYQDRLKKAISNASRTDLLSMAGTAERLSWLLSELASRKS